MAKTDIRFRDRRLILALIGVLLLSVGMFAAFLGPIEMYCFYLFSEGGPFHYPGFGFGSFMFGNITMQIVGYYLIAALAIPLGYGHLKPRRWARTFSVVASWFWFVLGIPLTILFLLILFSSKELGVAVALIIVVLMGLAYLAVPGLLIRFYQSKDVRLTFETRDPRSYWIERLPLPILLLGALFLFYAVVLHIPIFFNGLFPLFGIWLSGLEGIFVIDLSILCLACLIWGTLGLRTWAWWGSVAYFGLMTLSWVFTLARSSLSDILSKMRFPPTEMEILEGTPLQGLHLAAFVGVPFLITLGVILFSKRHFHRAISS